MSCWACMMWQAEATDLRERLTEARRQAKADEEMMRWLNAQARMHFMLYAVLIGFGQTVCPVNRHHGCS